MIRNYFFLFSLVLIMGLLFVPKVIAADSPTSAPIVSDALPSAAPSTYTVPVTGIPTQAPVPTDTPTPTPVPIFEPQLSPWLFIVPGIVLFAVIIF